MKPRPVVVAVVCLLASVLLGVAHRPAPNTVREATVLDLGHLPLHEVSRSYHRPRLAVEDLVDQTTTTTVAPTTTTTIASTATTTRRIRPITTTTTAVIEPSAGSVTGNSYQVPQSCYGHKMSRDQAYGCWAPLLAQYHWAVSQAFSRLYCESNGDTNAANGKYRGLLQIENGSFDPYENVAEAWGYYRRRGWQPWTCT